jgi:hypothetical protein
MRGKPRQRYILKDKSSHALCYTARKQVKSLIDQLKLITPTFISIVHGFTAAAEDEAWETRVEALFRERSASAI